VSFCSIVVSSVCDDTCIPTRGGRDGVVTQLHLLLLDLRLQRLEAGFGGLERSLRPLELLLADGAGREQLARPLLLLARVGDVGFPRGALRFPARHGGLLPLGIDLHQAGTLIHPIAGLHVDLRDLPVDLRLDGRRSQRFERRDVFGRVFEGGGAGIDDSDRGRREARGRSARALLGRSAAARRGRERQKCGGCRRPVIVHADDSLE
jgi:hypothetical protein